MKSYRDYQLAMGFVSPELPENITFKDMADDNYFMTIYYQDHKPLVAFFYSLSGEIDYILDILKSSENMNVQVDPRGNGHYVVDFIT